MARINKYRKGKVITSMQQLSCILERNEYIFWKDRPVHPGWIGSMTWRTLASLVKGKYFYYAVINNQWKEQNEN